MDGVAKEDCPKFNPRPGWGLNLGPPGLQSEISLTAPTSHTGKQLLSEAESQSMDGVAKEECPKFNPRPGWELNIGPPGLQSEISLTALNSYAGKQLLSEAESQSMDGVAKEECPKFNPRPGRGLNLGPPGLQSDISPTALTSHTGKQLLSEAESQSTDGVAKEGCPKFNPRPGRGLNLGPPGLQLEISPTALTSHTGKQLLSEVKSQSMDGVAKEGCPKFNL